MPLLFLALACAPVATDTSAEKSDDADGDGFTTSIDCDDADPAVGIAGTWYADSDGDGFGNPALAVEECTPAAGFVADGTDCDDADAASHPGGAEVCDEADNDCDGGVDEDAGNAPTWYLDLDGDFYGDAPETACEAPAGYVQEGGDCDDGDATINPGASEVCDGWDNDCDGDTDENDAVGAPTWFLDQDEDGYGAGEGFAACVVPSGYTDNDEDCNDLDPDSFPGAIEHCDDADEDCDGTVDNDAIDPTTWFVDGDADGFGDAPTVACDLPAGASAVDGDCDDTLANVYPSAVEHCDDVDEDCDGAVDNDVADPTGWYADGDGDGYGAGVATYTCDGPPDTVDNGDDCDDTDGAISPGGVEVCDDVDQDCDGVADDAAVDMVDWYDDVDGDGWGGETYTTACDQPPNTASAGGDCDDHDAGLTPGAAEHCDGLDEDCDGVADDSAVDRTSFYYDADGDGYGDPAVSTLLCEEGGGFVDNHDDCDDTDIAVFDTCPASCGTLVTYPGDVDFNGFGAASDMAAFCGTYNAIAGDMTIENTDVANLLDLACLCEVDGDVTVKKNSTFVSFEGADALEVIGGNLVVDDNDVLVDLTGLTGLEQIGGTFDLRSSNALLTGYGSFPSLVQIGSLSSRFTSFDGLESLATIDGNLSVTKDSGFTLDGLEGLRTVDGTLTLSGAAITSLAPLAGLTTATDITISGPSGISTLEELDSLATVSGTLSLTGLSISTLDGLETLTSLGGLSLSNMTALTDLGGVSHLTTLPDGLWVSNLDALPDLLDLGSLTSVGALSISNNALLYDLHGLDELTAATSAVTISGNDGLYNTGGLNKLATVGGGLTVSNHEHLTSVDGFESLTSVGGNLTLSQNDGITSAYGFGALETIGGNLAVESNGTNSFVGFDSLVSIGGSLSLGGSTRPAAATGLESVTSIGGTVTLNAADTSGLDAVTTLGGLVATTAGSDLGGLDALETVDGNFEVAYIAFGSGLGALTTVGGNLTLSTCDDAPTTIAVASNIQRVGGDLILVTCSSPTAFSGWTDLEEVGGALYITNLSNVAALPSWTLLSEVGGLYLSGDNKLADLAGLSSLRTISGYLNITSNNKLDSVTALHGVTAITTSFTMAYNPLITTAEAEALRDAIGTANIGGLITIAE